MKASPPPGKLPWQDTLNLRLLRRLLRPLLQPGVIAPELARRIVARVQQMGNALLLLDRLQRYLDDGEAAWSDLPLIVHVQAPHTAGAAPHPAATPLVEHVVVHPIAIRQTAASGAPDGTLALAAAGRPTVRGQLVQEAPVAAPAHARPGKREPLSHAPVARQEGTPTSKAASDMAGDASPLLTQPLRTPAPDVQRLVLPPDRRRRRAPDINGDAAPEVKRTDATEHLVRQASWQRNESNETAQATYREAQRRRLADAMGGTQGGVAPPAQKPVVTVERALDTALPTQALPVVRPGARGTPAAPPGDPAMRRTDAGTVRAMQNRRPGHLPVITAAHSSGWATAPMPMHRQDMGGKGAESPATLARDSGTWDGTVQRLGWRDVHTTPAARLPFERTATTMPSVAPRQGDQRPVDVDALVEKALRKLMRHLDVESERQGWRR